MKRKALPFIVLLAIFSGRAQAEEYSLDQLVEIAVSRSPQLRAADLDVLSREKEVSQAGVWENPNLDLGSENKSESGGSTKQWKVGLSQTFGVPGKYSLRGDVAESEHKISRLDRRNTELILRHGVLLRAFSFLASEERAKHAEERLSRFTDVQTYIRARTFASPQKRAEATIVTGKLLVLERDLLKLKAEADAHWEDLNLFLGLKSRPKIRTNWFRGTRSFSLEGLQEKLDGANPDLSRQKLIVEKSDLEVRLAEKDAWPAFTVSGSYGDGSGFAPEKTYGLGMSFPIPVFNANRAEIQASQFRRQAESTRLQFERDKAAAQLKKVLLRYETSRSAIQRLSVNRVPEIEKAMSITDQGFRKGQVDLLTYIEADSQHAETLEGIYAAQVEYLSFLSDLLTLVGESKIPLETQP